MGDQPVDLDAAVAEAWEARRRMVEQARGREALRLYRSDSDREDAVSPMVKRPGRLSRVHAGLGRLVSRLLGRS